MNLELLFRVSSLCVLPAWLLLLLAPRWRWTNMLVHRTWLPALLACAYGMLLLTQTKLPEAANMRSLAGLTVLFATPQAALMAWLHFLAFDLFVGAWLVRDSIRHQIRHVLVVPALLLTFMVGPLGLLLYLIIRECRKKMPG